VLTDATDVADLATQLGHQVIHDNTGNLCSSLDDAVRVISEQGARTVFVMPGDIPTVTAGDVDALMEKHCGGLSLCPAIRDGGTNAIVCTPPDALPFQFGENSAHRHLELARQMGLAVERLLIPAFFRDIDLPDDLVWLMTRDTGSNTIRFLRQSGITARLNMSLLGASA
jgi:2-phospho-L-lactate guanylyltransferase